jgi:hypothetical protein
MPALPAVPKVVRVVCVQTMQEDLNVINRFFMSYSGTAPANTDLTTWCGAIATAWGTDISPLQINNISLTGVSAEDLSSSTGAVGAAAVAVPGTRAGTPLTAAVCAVIQKKTLRRYRGGHPRMYLAAGVETDIFSMQSWKPAFTAAVLAGYAAFQDAIEAAGWAGAGTLEEVNVSYYQGFTNFTFPSGRTRPIPTRRGTPLVDTLATYNVDTHIGSQRRRNKQSA